MLKKIGIASGIMMASIFLSRALGQVREIVIAHTFGITAEVDAYQIAFVVPELLNHVVASGYLSITFIPLFSQRVSADDETAGWRLMSNVLTVFGAVLVVLIAAAVVGAPSLVRLMAPGTNDPQVLAAATAMTRIILPAQFFFFCGGLFMAVQYAKESFLIPALAPLIYNICIIAGGVLLGPSLGMAGFSWGVLVGAAVGSFGIQWWGARRVGMRFRPVLGISDPGLRQYVWLTLPLILGLGMTFSTELFFRLFGSFLAPGGIAGVNYALRTMMVLVGLFGQAVGVASYPYLARLAAESRLAEMHRLFNTTLKTLSLVIPMAALFATLRHELILLQFQHGQFAPGGTDMAATALGGLMIGAVAFTAQTMVVRGFYAHQRMWLPAIFQSVSVIFCIPLYWIGVSAWGIGGLSAAISLSALIQVVLLFVLWNRTYRNPDAGSVVALYGRMAVIGVLIWSILTLARRWIYQWVAPTGWWDTLGVCIGVTLVFLVCVAAVLRWAGIPEARLLADRWRRRQTASQ